MRIGIDARFLTHPQKGGFKTYTENLISALASLDGTNEYILYLDRLPNQNTNIPTKVNFSYKVLKQLPVIGMPWREQVELSFQTARDRIDLLHSPCLTAPVFSACPLVVTIHDMIWRFPQKYSQYDNTSLQWKLMEWYQLSVPRYTSRRASAVITVSQSSKEDIVEHLGIDPSLIFVTHEAVNSSFQPINEPLRTQELRKKYGLQCKYILALGSADPRKNIETLLNAYAMMPQETRTEYHLAIVWTAVSLAPSMLKHVQALGMTDAVHFLNQVSDEDLVLLYNEASVFVFPSLYEGFGLPILEAMACGTAVITAGNSSIPEIVGDTALLFDAQDTSSLSSAMVKVLNDESIREELSQKGLRRAAEFSWEECARQTLAIYKKVLLTD